jgi:hypothetical protein
MYAQRFLDILSAALPSDTPPDYQPDDDYPEPDPPLGFSLLFWRISPWEGLTHEHPRRWRYITSMWRTFPDMRVRCGVMIEFPHTDLPAVTDIITAAATEYRGEEEDDGP